MTTKRPPKRAVAATAAAVVRRDARRSAAVAPPGRTAPTVDNCSDVLKALAERTRQRIVKALLARDMSVNELTSQLAISQYNTSKHLGVLKTAGIVQVRPVGARREYSISCTLRGRIEREGLTLDFGCCTFRMDQLPD